MNGKRRKRGSERKPPRQKRVSRPPKERSPSRSTARCGVPNAKPTLLHLRLNEAHHSGTPAEADLLAPEFVKLRICSISHDPQSAFDVVTSRDTMTERNYLSPQTPTHSTRIDDGRLIYRS